ncbi:MAG TPA: serine/threonine-protein kinase [Gemmatimonadales bacterium]|nr:serine/threonine-protein kinase [Gemmatimonadales bacterium]
MTEPGTGSSGASRLDRVAALFAEALELEHPAAREALILAARGDDPALADELVALLTAHEEDPGFMAEPAGTELAEVIGRHLGSALVGRRVGSWEVDSILHHGGMGTVYHAHRADVDFDQHAALKVVRVDVGSAEMERRFAQERRLLARLEHPNIARLLDGGTTSDGVPYLVMEHVPGETIDAWCSREKPDIARLLAAFLQICSAVDFAHQNLVIHQDIKPSNILVTPEGIAKLLDFGIADLERQVTDGDDEPGVILLTPDYASPEQFRGDPAGTATDTYSLGVLLYRLLTGEVPYHITGGLSREEAGRMALETVPRTPGAVLAAKGRQAPPRGADLDAILLRALAKRPQDRYSSVRALADDVRRYLAVRPVEARTQSWSYRLSRHVGRNWAALAAAATILLLLVGGLSAALWQAGVAERQRDVARAEAATAASAVTFLKTVLGSADPWRDSNPAETVEDVIRLAEVQLDSVLGDEPAARAYVLAALGEVGAGRGELDRANRFTERAVNLLNDSLGGELSQAGAILHARSLALHENGRLEEARGYAIQAVGRLDDPEAGQWQELAGALNQLAALDVELGDHAAAEATARRAVELYRANDGNESLSLASVYNNLAVALSSQSGRLEEAAQVYAMAIRIVESQGGSTPALATLYSNRTNVLRVLGRHDEAVAMLDRAVELFTASLGSDHQATLTAAASLASLYEATGQFDKAAQSLRSPLASARATLPDDHPVTAYILSVLGSALCQADGSGTLEEGLAVSRESFDARRAALGEGHWAVASAEATVGYCLMRLGRQEEGMVMLRRAYQTLRDQRGEGHELTVRAGKWLDAAGAGQ